MAAKKSQRRKEPNPVRDMFMHPNNHLQEETPLEIMLQQTYPDIPNHYRAIWHSSDQMCQHNNERTLACDNLLSCLEKASSVCHQLKAFHLPMTPKKLKLYEGPLNRVIHSAHTILNMLAGDYPLPDCNAYTKMLESEELEALAPKLLLCSEERIIIWTNILPANNTAWSERLFAELEGFLYSTPLPHFEDWHCDFVHVHASSNLRGIRDVDNYLYKPFIDALSRALLAKDSYDHFSYSSYNYACDSIQPGWYIDITKRCEKVSFFEEFQNRICAITKE